MKATRLRDGQLVMAIMALSGALSGTGRLIPAARFVTARDRVCATAEGSARD
jgi:hypothetical protein